MKTLATALAGVLGVCVFAAGPVAAAPYDPFETSAGEEYYSEPAYDPYGAPRREQGYGGQGYSTQGYGVQAQGAPQAQVAPIPREIVSFNAGYKPGTIVVSTAERRLYFVLPGGEAIRYGVGVGRPGFTWSGTKTVTAKKEWPSWTPPAAMLARRPDLPRYMAGGVENPLGARAMYIGTTEYRIHGSNEPDTIGQAVSSGCIRMTNEDVTDLYERVRVGAKVVVLN
ncbi:MAG: L,D-transpeptidase [Methylobacterium sp.]|uniref:L,D-transpeptidase n=1 Tax=Methylobacterium sp. TaxID=409 RepID=UPI0025E6C1DE|nr:L,D-transpeptidase [Methylobacterium sp.]MBX9930973.1 L,D-transpeptidase [Methylobacterium sp.]